MIEFIGFCLMAGMLLAAGFSLVARIRYGNDVVDRKIKSTAGSVVSAVLTRWLKK